MTFDAFTEFSLNGQKMIITGGAQNIGTTIARTRSGAEAKVRGSGNDCRGMTCDVIDKAAIDAIIGVTVKAFDDISITMKIVGWGRRQEDPASIPEPDRAGWVVLGGSCVSSHSGGGSLEAGRNVAIARAGGMGG